MDVLRIVIGLLAAPSIINGMSAVPAKSDTVITVVSRAELKPKQAQMFADFSTNLRDYYGVFYIDLNADTGLGLSDFHDLENGMKYTRKLCEYTPFTDDNTCELYAIFMPSGSPSKIPNLRGLSQTASEKFAGEYIDGETSYSFSAFAVSPIYNFAFSLDQETQGAADAEAMAECTEGMAQYNEGTYPDILEFMAAENLMDCKIIDRTVDGE